MNEPEVLPNSHATAMRQSERARGVRAAEFFGASSVLRMAMDHYEHRPSQIRMAEVVEDVLYRGGSLLIEAGTGTGKTLAYLVPALLCGRRVVISTGTKTLQDQIMNHELPFLERHLGLSVQAACMKGLDNYLCLRRFEEYSRSAEGDRSASKDLLPLIRNWREQTSTGDRAELNDLPEDASIWGHVSSSSETRIGTKCEYFENCFVTKMRRAAEDAQLVVVNHHLFFADLATRGPHGGGIIPDYDAVIFDEAHQIEDVATQFFGVRVSLARIERLVRDGERALRAARELGDAAPLFANVTATSRHLFSMLPKGRVDDNGRSAWDFENPSSQTSEAVHQLDSALDALASHCKLRVSVSEGVAQMARRATQIRDDLAEVVSSKYSPSGAKTVAWVQQGTHDQATAVGATAIDVSDILRRELFDRVDSVVLTSATLSANGNFDFIKNRLGLGSETHAEILPTPFDYAKQSALYLPAHIPDPRSHTYSNIASSEIVKLIHLAEGGVFVLCTSLRAMRDFWKRCAHHISVPVFVQGDAPKHVLLERFRAAGNAVLFATVSFWEGVDVPGHALRLVIIDKLPFDVPTDPLISARCHRLKAQEVEPFMHYLVPSAALALKQGFGRLIRTRNDRGVVAILDSRIVKKGYGKMFLRTLPDATRCASFAEVESWWKGEAVPDSRRDESHR